MILLWKKRRNFGVDFETNFIALKQIKRLPADSLDLTLILAIIS
jgi:hypothetical protein